MSKCPGTQSKKAGFEKACQDCPNASYCQSEKIPDLSIDIIKQKFTNIPHIIAIMSGKGGVGKSFISKNIAQSISTYKKALLFDFDLTGPSIPRLTKTENQILYESNDILYPIKLTDSFYCLSVGHFSVDIKTVNSQLKNDIIKQILMNIDLSNIDTIIIDTPPGVSDEHLGLVNYMKIKAVMVTTPQQIAFADVIRQIDFCKRSGIEILGIIENMKGLVCNGCGHHNFVFEGGNQVMEYCERNNIRYLGGIALNQDIARKSDTGEDIEDPIFEKIAKSII